MQNDPQTLADAVEFVSLGYGDLIRKRFFRSLYFRTELLTTAQTQAVVRLLQSHNAFSGEKVALAIGKFSKQVRGWEFGRESSPVLYVYLPFTENQIEEQVSATVGPRIDPRKTEQVLAELLTTFKALGAQELEVEPKRRHEVRFWWD
jgi:hypothetical protein